MKWFGFLIIAICMECLSFFPATAGEESGWVSAVEDGAVLPPVERVTEAYPLSDQENKGGWKPYAPMSDEFEGETLDGEKWWPKNPTWKGRQPGWFSPDNVTVKDGKLNLFMRLQEPPEAAKADGYHTFTSAAVQSKGTTRYGYFEVKAKPMNSAGSSSFWFYNAEPKEWTEIDVFEIGGKAPGFERKLNMTLHVMRTPEEEKHKQFGTAWMAPFNLADDYHVYGLEWDEKEIRIYVDGRLVRNRPNTYWHQALMLNFDSETMPEWFGLPKPEDLPSTYSIEYVRAWKKEEKANVE